MATISAWNKLPRMSIDQLSVSAQAAFLKKFRGRNEVVACVLDKKFHFKDESNTGLRGSYHVGLFERG